MTDEVLKFIKKENMIAEGDTVIAGVSGGADSVCLLCVLAELRARLSFALEAVHVEHGIRGAESVADAEFTKVLCEKLSVPCRVYAVDVPAYAAEHKLGLEEAARILRYESYRKAAGSVITGKCVDSVQPAVEKSGGCADVQTGQRIPRVRIALAHHAEDNAETVLFQMIRGSGIDGMSGIRPRRLLMDGVEIIRPLLCVSRGQIEAYLAERGQDFCTDSTNADMDYSRNKIRHQILPELTQLNPQAVPHINQSAGFLREIGDYLEMQVAELTEKHCKMDAGRLYIYWEGLERAPRFLQREVVHEAIKMAAGSGKDITASHIEKTTELFNRQVGRQISLPYQLIARRCYEGLVLERADLKEQKEASFSYEVSAQQIEDLLDGGVLKVTVPDGTMQLRILEFCGEIQEISKKRYTKWLDYDRIKCGLQIRSRRSGDYLTISEDGHRKSLKEYFINEKIPAGERERVLLFTQESHVIWVVGGRISTDYKLKKDTKRMLEVQISGGSYYED